MLTEGQLFCLRRLAEMRINALPSTLALAELMTMLDICEGLQMMPREMGIVFGPTVLNYLTEIAYGEPGGMVK